LQLALKAGQHRRREVEGINPLVIQVFLAERFHGSEGDYTEAAACIKDAKAVNKQVASSKQGFHALRRLEECAE
jgi:hypothetical protein